MEALAYAFTCTDMLPALLGNGTARMYAAVALQQALARWMCGVFGVRTPI